MVGVFEAPAASRRVVMGQPAEGSDFLVGGNSEADAGALEYWIGGNVLPERVATMMPP